MTTPEWFQRSLGPVPRTGLARKFREALIVGADEGGVPAISSVRETDGSGEGLLQFTNGAWTDASGRGFALGIGKVYFLTVSCR